MQKALSLGLIGSLEDFYTGARTVLIKSERYFDLYDQVFAHCFRGAEMREGEAVELDEAAKMLLEEWLRDPEGIARALGAEVDELMRLTPQQLLEYFLERLKEQTEAHHGGSKWIGTRGTSPVGHSGFHPGGMRVGGRSQGQSAVKFSAPDIPPINDAKRECEGRGRFCQRSLQLFRRTHKIQVDSSDRKV